MRLCIFSALFLLSQLCSGAVNSGTPLNTMLGMMLKERNCQDFWFDNDYDYSPTSDSSCGGRRCNYPNEVCMIKAFSSIDTNGINDRDEYKCKRISRNCMSALDGTGSSSGGFTTRGPVVQPTQPTPVDGQRCSDPNARFSTCASHCPQYCGMPTTQCIQSCRRGCECREGYVRRTNSQTAQCIPANQCPSTGTGNTEATAGLGARICNPDESCVAWSGSICECPSGQTCWSPQGLADYGRCRAPENPGGQRTCNPGESCLTIAGQVCECPSGQTCYTPPGFRDYGTCRSTGNTGGNTGGNEQARCNLDRDSGRFCGRRYQRKFFYNKKRRQCATFYYGGCAGNDNRFDTIQECRRVCESGGSGNSGITVVPRTTTTTQSPRLQSDCSNSPGAGDFCPGSRGGWKRPWSFQNGRCVQFWYKGCGGNGNRYRTEAGCLRNCRSSGGGTVTRPPRPQPGGGSSTSVRCRGGPVRGSGRNYQLKWYYNAQRRSCQQFWWGGSGGSPNRFNTRQQCNQTCRRRG